MIETMKSMTLSKMHMFVWLLLLLLSALVMDAFELFLHGQSPLISVAAIRLNRANILGMIVSLVSITTIWFDGSGFLGSLDVFHQLHCLVSVTERTII